MWVKKGDVGKKLEDIPAPFSDVKNILKEIDFKDETTRSRCKGWLILPSRKYLQADILFPGCAFDCRLHIRGRIGTIWCNSYEYVNIEASQYMHLEPRVNTRQLFLFILEKKRRKYNGTLQSRFWYNTFVYYFKL